MTLEFHHPRPHTMEALLQTLATNARDVTHWIPLEAAAASVCIQKRALLVISLALLRLLQLQTCLCASLGTCKNYLIITAVVAR